MYSIDSDYHKCGQYASQRGMRGRRARHEQNMPGMRGRRVRHEQNMGGMGGRRARRARHEQPPT